MKKRSITYLWPDVLWLALALALVLACCGAEAALDAWEASPTPPAEPTPIITPQPYQEHCVFPDERVTAALAVTLGTEPPAEEPGVEPVHSAADLYVVERADDPPADVPLTGEEWSALLDACEAGHITTALGLGLIETESGFDREIVNGPCYGLCQLHTGYFPAGLTPAENITAGIGYLADRLEAYDDLEAGLTAYRWGYDNGDRTYAAAVLSAMEKYEGVGA